MPVAKPTDFYIGLMSGTSLDGIDIAIVDFTETSPEIIYTNTVPYRDSIKAQISEITNDQSATIDSLFQLDIELGKVYAHVVNQSLAQTDLKHSQIRAIGCHGQTIRHCPDAKFPYTVQSGDPSTIAVETGITAVADFRQKDIALGGQGAPLAPAFHEFMFSTKAANRVIINIGGIANITYLPADPNETVYGYDTGPGNTLLDYWVHKHQGENYDHRGQWAKNGKIINQLLDTMLTKEPYFDRPPPKSTGTDYFNSEWLNAFHPENYVINDVQSTLLELTAVSIANDITKMPDIPSECFICGGGANNLFLIERIQQALPKSAIKTTSQLNIDPNYVEAIAFAWLARQRINCQPGNIPSVTHASKPAVLGGIYSGAP